MYQSILRSGEVGNIGYKQLSETRRLATSKWESLGYLEGLEGQQKDNIATLFENQAHHMINESTVMDASGSFEAIAFPVIRRTFTKLLLNDIASLQAMTMPIGRIYFFNPKISKRVATTGRHMPMDGSFTNGAGFYTLDADGRKTFTANPSTGARNLDKVGGVQYEQRSLYDAFQASDSNDYGDALFNRTSGQEFKHAIALAVDSSNSFATGVSRQLKVNLTGFSMSSRDKLVGPVGVPVDTEEFLSTLLITSSVDMTVTGAAGEVTVIRAHDGTTATPVASDQLVPYRVLAQVYAQPLVTREGKLKLEVNLTSSDRFGNYVGLNATAAPALTAHYSTYSDMEGDAEMAEVTFDFEYATVSVGEPKKLRASFTPEVKADVEAFQNIDVEAELSAMLSEMVSMEIDREGLRDIRNGAAWFDRWDSKGYDKKLAQQNSVIAITRKDWNQGLIEVINYMSAAINKSTMRGGANWIVVSAEVQALLRNLEYFHISNATPEENKFSLGIEKIGAIQNEYTVYKDVCAPANTILVGHKGDGILHAGYIHAPYCPLMLFPKQINPADFRTVMGVMTRYAKKMINNRFYGKIYVDNLSMINVREYQGVA